MRWIYISPHFDDAVLSCGGLIWEQTQKGNPVEIWTVCAGDAPPGPLSLLALDCHRQWGIESAAELVAARRLENQEAAALVGAETVDYTREWDILIDEPACGVMPKAPLSFIL